MARAVGGWVNLELATLASAAATTIVKALTTTAWEQAKTAIGSLWRKVHPDRAEAVESEITDAHEQLVNAGHTGDEAEDLVTEWRSRLGRLLAADPGLADEVRQLVEQLRPATQEGRSVTIGRVEMHVEVSDQGRAYQALGDQHITER